jgi:hypothetical protein
MLLRSTILGLLAVLTCGICVRAEVEYPIHDGYSGKVQFPVLVSLRDKDGFPVKGAVIALKRLGPDGWSEEEIVREAESRTDKNGMIVVMYPGTATMTSPGQSSVEIYGAVTIVAEGYRTVTIELRKYFKEGRYELAKDTVPHLKLDLTDEPTPIEKLKIPAQQAVPPKGP